MESRPGAGTTMTLYLPAAAAADAGPRAHTEAVRPGAVARVSSATALVVEDDAAVREPASDMLREGGWRVIAAADGREALAALGAGEAVDMLFSDVVLGRGDAEQPPPRAITPPRARTCTKAVQLDAASVFPVRPA